MADGGDVVERVAAAIRENFFTFSNGKGGPEMLEGGIYVDGLAQVVAEALHPTITTGEQLDALPHRALVVREYTSQAGWHLNEVWEKRNDNWFCLAAPLIPPSQNWGTPLLPASLVYVPGAVGVLSEQGSGQ